MILRERFAKMTAPSATRVSSLRACRSGVSSPVVLALLAAFGLALTFLAASSALPAHALPTAAPSFTSEKGKFKILVNGRDAGKEEFEITQKGGDWIAHGVSEIQTAQGTTKITGNLEFRADGSPIKYDWSTEGAKKASASIGFKGATATIDLHVDGARSFTQQFTFGSPQVAILDNNLYHQYAVLARMYDWNKKGAQSFSVLVPQEMTPGTVTVESLGKVDADGKKWDELSVKSQDLELDLFLENQRLVRIAAPASNAEILRE